MVYRIDYIPVGKRRYSTGRKAALWLLPTLTVLLLLAAAFALSFHYGSADWLLPGDPAVTRAALTDLIESLKAGELFPDAVTAFCREVLSSGT